VRTEEIHLKQLSIHQLSTQNFRGTNGNLSGRLTLKIHKKCLHSFRQKITRTFRQTVLRLWNRDGPVSIVTRPKEYLLSFRESKSFSVLHSVRNLPEAHPPEALSLRVNIQGLRLTTHCSLQPRSRIGGAITPLPPSPLRSAHEQLYY
jgi:hypothetical protein